jgi:hypothetical protein
VVPVSNPKVYAVPKDEAGATATPVRPLQPTGAWQPNEPKAASLPSSAAATTPTPAPEQLDALLQSRGVIGHKQEVVPGGIHLICAVSSPTNPNANQIYETTAPDYATAVQAIVAQIDAHRP